MKRGELAEKILDIKREGLDPETHYRRGLSPVLVVGALLG